MIHRPFIFLCVISCLLFSCADLLHKVVKEPKVDLARVSCADTDLTGTKLLVTLRVQNPNNFALKLDQLNYKVMLEGKEFTTASTTEALEVPASSTKDVTLPIPVQFSQLFVGLQNLLLNRKMEYQVDGDARVSGFKVPFTKTGKVEL